MSIVQIGARLVRKFGEGKNLRIVVSETLNGKTLTKVLDSNGNTIINKAKKIDRYEVGNKKVSTITKVSEESGYCLEKTVTDRVYDAESGLLGMRRTYFLNVGRDTEFVKLSTAKRFMAGDRRGINKKFDEYGIAKSRGIFADGHRILYHNSYGLPVRGSYPCDYACKILEHNNKGLPIPRGTNPEEMKDMKLAEMRCWHVLHNPDLSYAPGEFRLWYLNKQDEVLGTIHDLDKFF